MPAEVAGYVCNSFDRCLVMRGDDHGNIGAYRLCSECVRVCVCVCGHEHSSGVFVFVGGRGRGTGVYVCGGSYFFFKGCVHNYPANS